MLEHSSAITSDPYDAGEHTQVSGQPVDMCEASEQALAKIICHSGEYLCALRDVSELGTSLSFFHAVPPEPRIILQLANGLTYPIERVWIGKKQAGYRFGSDISMEEFLAEGENRPSRPIRLSVQGPAIIKNGEITHRVSLSDLSCEGARFGSEAHLPLNCLLGITIEGFKARLGQLRWRDGREYGMQFQHPLSREELAQCAKQLQPFGSPFPHLLGDALSKARAA